LEYRLHLQGKKQIKQEANKKQAASRSFLLISCLVYSAAMKVEAILFSSRGRHLSLLHSVQLDSGAQSISNAMGTRVSFPSSKAAGA
jgi:hypothetical protein